MTTDQFFIDFVVFVVFARLGFALLMVLLEQLGLKDKRGVKVTIRGGK